MPSPITFPASRWRGLTVGEQHLDDARGLLLHHAGGDEVADPDQLPVEQQHGEEGEAAAALALLAARRCVTRSGGGESASRASRSPTPACASASALRTRAFAACRISTSLSSGSSCARIASPVSAASTSATRRVRLHGHVGVERLADRDRGLGDRPGVGRERGDRVGVAAAEAEQVRQQHDEQDDRQRDARADQERALAGALDDLAPGDQPHGLAPAGSAKRTRKAKLAWPAHAATAWRKRSASEGRSSEKWVTVPARAGRVEQPVGGAVAREAGRAAPCGPRRGHLGAGHGADPVAAAVALDPDADLLDLAAAALPQLLHGAVGDEPAVLDDRHVLAEALDELELVAGEDDRARPRAARSASTPLITSTPVGSSPENGSSSTSTSGSWTRATPSWTRCWLPSESVSTRSPARSVRPSRSIQASAAACASPAASPWSRAKWTSWSRTRIFGYRPRSSGM